MMSYDIVKERRCIYREVDELDCKNCLGYNHHCKNYLTLKTLVRERFNKKSVIEEKVEDGE